MAPKKVLHVSVQELHNIMVSPPGEGGMEEAIYSDNNTIINDYTIHNIISPKLKYMSVCYKVVCGCECFITSKSMHDYLLKFRDSNLKQLKYQSHNAQNRSSGQISSRMF